MRSSLAIGSVIVSFLEHKIMTRVETYGVENGTKNVQGPLKDDKTHAHPVLHFLVSIDRQAMDDGDDARQAQADEHHSSIGAPCGRAECIHPRDYTTAETKHEYLT